MEAREKASEDPRDRHASLRRDVGSKILWLRTARTASSIGTDRVLDAQELRSRAVDAWEAAVGAARGCAPAAAPRA